MHSLPDQCTGPMTETTNKKAKILPVISRWMHESIGRGRDRKVNGSNLTLVWPHSMQWTQDLSWPWNKSTTIDWFRNRWFSHASLATTSSGRPSLSFNSTYGLSCTLKTQSNIFYETFQDTQTLNVLSSYWCLSDQQTACGLVKNKNKTYSRFHKPRHWTDKSEQFIHRSSRVMLCYHHSTCWLCWFSSMCMQHTCWNHFLLFELPWQTDELVVLIQLLTSYWRGELSTGSYVVK